MKLSGYGIEFESLKPDQLELVRQWRNQPAIRSRMLYQQEISSEQQSKWYQSINNCSNCYFVFGAKGKPIGLINIKEINWLKLVGEGGIFVGDQAYLNSFVPIGASLLMAQFSLFLLPFKYLYAKVKADNPRAIDYNRRLGYEQMEDLGDYVRMAVSRESFETKAKKITQAYLTQQNLSAQPELQLQLEQHDIDNGWYEQLQQYQSDAATHSFVIHHKLDQ